jgi:hypothetical protein
VTGPGPSPRHRLGKGPAPKRSSIRHLPVGAVWLFGAVWALGFLSGCRGDPALDEGGVHLDIAVAPTPPVAGPARIVFALHTAEGAPIEGAELQVEGTMSHAGMLPVLERAEDVGEGNYLVPSFEFTMGGDWILIIRIELPDGREVMRREELRVVSGGAPGDR